MGTRLARLVRTLEAVWNVDRRSRAGKTTSECFSICDALRGATLTAEQIGVANEQSGGGVEGRASTRRVAG